MGLKDDSEETVRFGVWESRPPSSIIVDASAWNIICNSQLDQAQRIGRARAEAQAARDAIADHASPYFVLQQIDRVLEALR